MAGHHSEGRYDLTKAKGEVAYCRRRAEAMLENASTADGHLPGGRRGAAQRLLLADSRTPGRRRHILHTPPLCTMEPDYLAALHELPLHTGMLAGAGILRADAAGYELEHLADAHYRAIHRAMERALADGALGISLGLGYAPECFYTTEELIRALEAPAGTRISPSPSICGRRAPVSAGLWRRCLPWPGRCASLCTSAT